MKTCPLLPAVQKKDARGLTPGQVRALRDTCRGDWIRYARRRAIYRPTGFYPLGFHHFMPTKICVMLDGGYVRALCKQSNKAAKRS